MEEVADAGSDLARDNNPHGVSLLLADESQGDGGVAAAGFHDGAAGTEVAFGFGVLDHGEGDAVLDATAGILSLQLGEDANAGFGGQVRELDQRGVSDESEDGGSGHGHQFLSEHRVAETG